MDKYAEYLDDADDASGESTKMMREAMAHTEVRHMMMFLLMIVHSSLSKMCCDTICVSYYFLRKMDTTI